MKTEVVLRLLRGESLDALARETRQTASRLAEWRDGFLAGGERAMKARTEERDGLELDEERKRLQAKVGESMMENELLREKIARLEKNHPFPWGRSKR